MAKYASDSLMKGQRSLRLSGIDILRGFALLGVAILHAGNGKPSSGWAKFLEDFSTFAVPFFLATSFYFATKNFYSYKATFTLQTRLSRLLTPYTYWILIYIIFTGLKYCVSGKASQFSQIFQDPISIIFFGSPAYHLYFIPLLVVGTILLKIVQKLFQTLITLKILLILLPTSIILYQITLVTGNAFELGSNIAFQAVSLNLGLNLQELPALRVGLVTLAWSLRCLPYISLALLLQHPCIQKHHPQGSLLTIFFTGVFFLLINVFGRFILPIAMFEIVRGYAALFFAILLSTIFPESKVINSLGLCSFGIYLMHLIWVETIKTLLGRIAPSFINEVSVLTLLTFSISACLISWIVTEILIRYRSFLPKLLFGI